MTWDKETAVNAAPQQSLTLEDEQARQQAISLASRRPLPITARSMTPQEIAAIDRLYYPAIPGVYGVGALGLLAAVWFGDSASVPMLPIVAAVLILFVPLWLFARWKAGRR